MIKKILTSLLILLFFVLSSTEVFAEYIGGNPGMDFFKKIDSGSSSVQIKFMENELQGSAKKINDFLISNSYGCGNTGIEGCFDEGKDFTYKERQEISEDGNIIAISSHLKEEFKGQYSDNLYGLYGSIYTWFDAKQRENLAKEASMSRVGVIGLFNDGDVNNSGYDLMYDLDKIHKVIFAEDTNYTGDKNNSSSDFGGVMNGNFNNISSVYNPNGEGGAGGGGRESGGGASGNTNSSIGGTVVGGGESGLAGNNNTTTKSNLCESGSNVSGLDIGLLNDLTKQLNNGTNSNSSQGGKGNQNVNGNNNGGNNQNGSNSDNGGNNSLPGSGNGLTDNEFGCVPGKIKVGIDVCIDLIIYKQSLLGGGKSETIEGILDKHLKIIDQYANKSLIQSDMTKNFFSLSILRKLNLPSMLHLGIVVTHMPVPILNLKKSSGSDNDEGEFKDKIILERAFDQNGLDYKTQNNLNPIVVTGDVTNCNNLNTNECVEKLMNTQNLFAPTISNVNILESKLGEKYKGSLNNDIAEFVGFSNSFKANIDGILGTIQTMKKTKK